MKTKALNPPSCVALSCSRRRRLPACLVSKAGCSMQLPSNTTIDHNTDRMSATHSPPTVRHPLALSRRPYTTRKHLAFIPSRSLALPALPHVKGKRRPRSFPHEPVTEVPAFRPGRTRLPHHNQWERTFAL